MRKDCGQERMLRSCFSNSVDSLDQILTVGEQGKSPSTSNNNTIISGRKN